MGNNSLNNPKAFFASAISLVTLLSVAGCNSTTSETATPSHMAVTTFGCQSKATAERISQLNGANDQTAAVQFVAANMSTGECASFNKGTPVLIEARTMAGLVNIRPEGTPTSYWTVREAVGP